MLSKHLLFLFLMEDRGRRQRMKQAAGILEDAKNPEKWKEFL